MAQAIRFGGGAITTTPKTAATIRCSPRQSEMLRLAANGMTDKAIAHRLNLSVCTVRSYWQRLYKENGIHSRTTAVVGWLMLHGLFGQDAAVQGTTIEK
jgi:DNA-binding NarL/FixJ family response regulator